MLGHVALFLEPQDPVLEEDRMVEACSNDVAIHTLLSINGDVCTLKTGGRQEGPVEGPSLGRPEVWIRAMSNPDNPCTV